MRKIGSKDQKILLRRFNSQCIRGLSSWEKMDKSFRYNIQIDPGQAFGTGSHQTTKLCIEWLLQNEKKFSNVIDYGCEVVYCNYCKNFI